MSMDTVPAKEMPNGKVSSLQGGRRAATIHYSERADVAEIFADSITNLLVDTQLMRIEFAVTRLDEMKPNAPITGHRYPACRVVLSSSAAIDLMNRLRQVATAFAQAPKPATQPAPDANKPDYDSPTLFEQACLSP